MKLEDLKKEDIKVPLPIKRGAFIELTGAKIKEVCAQNPSHPLAIEKLKSIEGFPDTQRFGVETMDVQAILENKEIEIVESVVGGRKIIQKSFNTEKMLK